MNHAGPASLASVELAFSLDGGIDLCIAAMKIEEVQSREGFGLFKGPCVLPKADLGSFVVDRLPGVSSADEATNGDEYRLLAERESRHGT